MTTSKSTEAGIYAACRLGLAMTALARRCVRLPAVGRVPRRTPSVPALERGSGGGRGAYACPALLSNVDEVARPGDASRDGVTFTHLDEPLFDGAGATKRDLVDYLETLRGRYGLWEHYAHPQLSRWLTFDLECSLRRLADGDWVGNEEPATFTPYKRGPRRY